MVGVVAEFWCWASPPVRNGSVFGAGRNLQPNIEIGGTLAYEVKCLRGKIHELVSSVACASLWIQASR